MLLLAGLIGSLVTRLHNPGLKVHAQETSGSTPICTSMVPKSWGEFKGGSDYGLAFEDQNGTLRFVLHPACGSLNSTGDQSPPPIDLEVQRK
jgi:hypothetical protein